MGRTKARAVESKSMVTAKEKAAGVPVVMVESQLLLLSPSCSLLIAEGSVVLPYSENPQSRGR